MNSGGSVCFPQADKFCCCDALGISVKVQPMAKNPAAVALGKLGSKARMKKLTPEQRTESARIAANARWAKVKKSSPRPQSRIPFQTSGATA
jgi:hypothetical protein